MRRSVVLIASVVLLLAPPLGALADSVDDLRNQLEAKKSSLQDIENQIQQFQQNMLLKRTEAHTLESQISLMDDNITELQLVLSKTQAQVDQTNSQIDSVSTNITAQEQQLTSEKELLANYIRNLHDLDQQSSVAVFLKYQNLSEIISEASTFSELHDRAQATFAQVQALHDELLQKRRDLEDYKQTVVALQTRQQEQQQTLASQKDAKARILDITKAQESKFGSLLAQAQASHKQADTEITQLDAALRDELAKQGIGTLPSVGSMDWPIDPIFGVSCEFHCPGYPYAYLIGPHSGMDIPTYVGTPIQAPADGYMARMHDSGGPGYSYIMMIAGDGVSMIFGHVSGFAANVREGEMITRGTVIGYTGGAAGMHGAGLSTGPHLHFEVRKNDVPVNPRNYLKSQPN